MTKNQLPPLQRKQLSNFYEDDMTDLVGPNSCPECGGEYGEHDSELCSKHPENRYHKMPFYLCENGLVVHDWNADKYIIRRYDPNDPVDGPSWDVYLKANCEWGSETMLALIDEKNMFDSLEAAVRVASSLQ